MFCQPPYIEGLGAREGQFGPHFAGDGVCLGLEPSPHDNLVLPHPFIGCLHQLVEGVGCLRGQVGIALQVG